MFAFRLASHLRTTVRSLLHNIDSAELTEWMAFERLEPFGVHAEEFRLGAVAAAIYNVQRSKPEHHLFKPSDFMPSLSAALLRTSRQKDAEGDGLTPDQHAALMDASIFGMTKQ